jgi:UDP-N-acetylmuramoyl-L-alanyl-D-glutamate--2,6-diaminopimelate ligase
MKNIIPQAVKNIYHLFRAILANVWYEFPSRKLKVIGVTGTNGKTTTVQMIAKILEEANHKIAVASTINFKLAGKEWVNKSKFTTLSSWALQKFLREAATAECEYAVLEISSHSLDQNRVWGTCLDVAVVTNVTREHLDYHETMEEYAKVKEKLFSGWGGCGKLGELVSVVNLAMDFAENFLKYEMGEKFGYILGTQNAKRKTQNDNSEVKTIIAEEIELWENYSKFKIQNLKFTLNLPGEFNIENALAATCVGLSQNIPLEKISAALAKIKGVPGRMEKIENSRGLNIIVDYAVTPDSLKKLYNYLNRIKKKGSKIISVFGSCGERDRGKRPIMGEIVAKYADYCIVTNEDPYWEDPARIINEVFSGVVGKKVQGAIPNFQFSISNSQISKIKTEGENAFRILDRREAIKTALQIAKPGDIVVVTGKGAEEIMAVGDERISWNDPEIIREVLRKTASEKNQ